MIINWIIIWALASIGLVVLFILGAKALAQVRSR